MGSSAMRVLEIGWYGNNAERVRWVATAGFRCVLQVQTHRTPQVRPSDCIACIACIAVGFSVPATMVTDTAECQCK
jgi:hypothetical protein